MTPTEGQPRALARVETAAAGLLIAVLVVGVALLPLTTAPVVRALVTALGSEELTGIGLDATLETAETVRVFVLDRDAPDLPLTVSGMPGFDDAAAGHLIDVRDVLVPARQLTVVLAVVVGIWAAMRFRSRDGRRRVGASMKVASVILVVVAALGVLAGLADFGALFTWFHGLFFASGTWTFPESALLIRVFPLPFWTTAGAIWGALVLMFAGFLFIGGRRLCFTEGTYGV